MKTPKRCFFLFMTYEKFIEIINPIVDYLKKKGLERVSITAISKCTDGYSLNNWNDLRDKQAFFDFFSHWARTNKIGFRDILKYLIVKKFKYRFLFSIVIKKYEH
jgi:hypothetical protein